LKPLYQRSIIVAAGPLANYVLAILIFAMINMFVGKDFTPAVVNVVHINSPAYEAGINKNDMTISIDKNNSVNMKGKVSEIKEIDIKI